MPRRASVKSEDFQDVPMSMVMNEYTLPPSHLMPGELSAILSYIGRLPAAYVAKLLPFELVLTIHQAMWVRGSTVHKPRGAATRINFRRLGDSAKLIINYLISQQHTSRRSAKS